MSSATPFPSPGGGIRFIANTAGQAEACAHTFAQVLQAMALQDHVDAGHGGHAAPPGRNHISFMLREDAADRWAPERDTTALAATLGLDTASRTADLEREIILAMLLSPIPLDFPSHAELMSHVRIRRNIVLAARKTALAFHTTEVDRPEDCWTYSEDAGFTVRPGHALIEALQKATQPESSGRLYSFSCYRATEYVILLGIAQELQACNPELLARLQARWERRAIMSGKFHDVFLREYGSMQAPLPAGYYVPGDRLWFRNPDEHSSDVSGYEGSWVMYLGGGLFTNFWKRDQPFTLTTKCLELYHWRNATYTDGEGELRIDESIVEAGVRQAMADPAEAARILGLMRRMREPKGVYVAGGCIDTSREAPRWVCPGTTDLVLPAD